MGQETLIRETLGHFEKHFGRAPSAAGIAPGRINLIGEHIDYNGGVVLPAAIEAWTCVAAAPSADGITRILSSAYPESVVIERLERGKPSWANYVKGVLAGFRGKGIEIPPFEALIHSNVPTGGGLSSSAALLVAMATMLESLTHARLDPKEKALLCVQAEHEFAGLPCGAMDQLTSVLAQKDTLLKIDCRSLETEPIPFDDPEVVLAITNSQVHHTLSESEYPKRRQQCSQAAKILGVPSLRDASLSLLESHHSRLDEVLYRRARHVVTEIDRTLQTVEAVRRRDWDCVGKWMNESHHSLRDDYEVSCAEIDLLVELAWEQGALGSRITGGGFGGCAISLIPANQIDVFRSEVGAEYQVRTGHEALIFVTHLGDGARIVI